MAKTMLQMAGEAQAAVPGISPEEAQRRRQEDPNTLVIDVRHREQREWSTAGRVRALSWPALWSVRGLGQATHHYLTKPSDLEQAVTLTIRPIGEV